MKLLNGGFVFFRVFKKVSLVMLLFSVSTENLSAQTTIEWNVLVDTELSKAGNKSHYYYNEIDQDHTDLRVGISQVNLTGQINFGKNWSFNSRFLLEREKGQELKRFVIPKLNIALLSKNRKFGMTLGSFNNPFGSFNKNQLSTDRDQIGLPLAYAFYHNISDKIGFMEGMGDVIKTAIDDEVQWGTSNIYYGGYTTGAMFSWNIKPSKVNWKIALVSGASNLQKRSVEPLNFGIISRLKIQPKYFWEQGFSVSHGTFFLESEVSSQLENLNSYRQTLIGTDYNLGYKYFEFSGEIMGTFYSVPQFNAAERKFDEGVYSDSKKLSNLAAYLDIKYEPPVLQGSYIAYRLDHLRFGKIDSNSGAIWDNNVLRHSLAVGYHINKNVLVRAAVSTQHVDRKEWDKSQRTFRFVLTAHY